MGNLVNTVHIERVINYCPSERFLPEKDVSEKDYIFAKTIKNSSQNLLHKKVVGNGLT